MPTSHAGSVTKNAEEGTVFLVASALASESDLDTVAEESLVTREESSLTVPDPPDSLCETVREEPAAELLEVVRASSPDDLRETRRGLRPDSCDPLGETELAEPIAENTAAAVQRLEDEWFEPDSIDQAPGRPLVDLAALEEPYLELEIKALAPAVEIEPDLRYAARILGCVAVWSTAVVALAVLISAID